MHFDYYDYDYDENDNIIIPDVFSIGKSNFPLNIYCINTLLYSVKSMLILNQRLDREASDNSFCRRSNSMYSSEFLSLTLFSFRFMIIDATYINDTIANDSNKKKDNIESVCSMIIKNLSS